MKRSTPLARRATLSVSLSFAYIATCKSIILPARLGTVTLTVGPGETQPQTAAFGSGGCVHPLDTGTKHSLCGGQVHVHWRSPSPLLPASPSRAPVHPAFVPAGVREMTGGGSGERSAGRAGSTRRDALLKCSCVTSLASSRWCLSDARNWHVSP